MIIDQKNLSFTLKEIKKRDWDEHAIDKPISLGHKLALDLSESQLRTITDDITEEIDQILKSRKAEGLDDKIALYRNQYFGIVEENPISFLGAFNIPVPLTQKMIDAAVSQTLEAFEESDPKWILKIRNQKEADYRDQQEQILDYYSDQEMESRAPWEKVYHDAYLLGNGFLGCPYIRSTEHSISYRKYHSLEQFLADFYSGDIDQVVEAKHRAIIEKLANGEEVFLEVDQETLSSDTPRPEHYAWEDVIVPIGTHLYDGDVFIGLNQSHLVARRMYLRFDQISKLEAKGDFIAGCSATIKKLSGNTVSASGGNDPDQAYSDFYSQMYECFEIQYLLPSGDDDGEYTRSQFIILHDSELGMTVPLQAIRYPYYDQRCSIIPYVIRHTKPGLYQEGLGAPLHPLNITLNAIVSHTLNASLLANSLSLKVKENSGAIAMLYEHKWYPGSPLVLENLTDVEQLAFGTPNLNGLLTLLGIIERFGEDVTGMVNYMFGKESGDDPNAPASKTIALMRKGEIRLRRYVKNLKDSVNEFGYQALRRIYQFKEKEEIAEILGIDPKDVLMPARYLRPQAQAAGFSIEKAFAEQDDMKVLKLVELLQPEVLTDQVKRMRLLSKIVKNLSSGWDKKLMDIISEEEILEKRKLQEVVSKKMEVIKQGVRQAMSQGADEQSAKQVGERAGELFTRSAGADPEKLKIVENEMLAQMKEKAMMAQQNADGGSSGAGGTNGRR